MEATQECYMLSLKNPGSNTPQNNNCTSHLANHSSKTNKTYRALLEKQGRSHVTFTYRLQHIDAPVLADQPKSYIHQLCADTGCSLEDLSGVMDDRDRWQKEVRKHHHISVTWRWWDCYIYCCTANTIKNNTIKERKERFKLITA